MASRSISLKPMMATGFMVFYAGTDQEGMNKILFWNGGVEKISKG
jgi:hypothetical protein